MTTTYCKRSFKGLDQTTFKRSDVASMTNAITVSVTGCRRQFWFPLKIWLYLDPSLSPGDGTPDHGQQQRGVNRDSYLDLLVCDVGQQNVACRHLQNIEKFTVK